MIERYGVLRYAWIVWALIILLLLLAPSSSLPAEVPLFPGLDKVVHFMLFAVLYILVAKASKYQQSGRSKYTILLYVSAYSVFTEFAQLYFDRTFDIFDIIANIMGAYTAHLFFNRKQN